MAHLQNGALTPNCLKRQM